MSEKDANRESFEEWAKSEGYKLNRFQDFGAYLDSDTAFAWCGYQAAIDNRNHQRDSMLTLLQEIQNGQQFTPEFCLRIDAVIEQAEPTN